MSKEGKFFVYGTLKMGGRFAELYADRFNPSRKSVTPAKIKGRLFHLGGFPGVKLDQGEGEVHGELHIFENPEKIKQIFDMIEGYNPNAPESGLFNCVEVEAELEDGSTETALMYTFNGEVGNREEIKSGVWEI